jgi:hypothetical protein
VGPGADLQIDIRLGDIEFFKEKMAHFFVIVLSRMNQQGFKLPTAIKAAHDGGNFHKIGASATDTNDFRHWLVLSF